jgi:hypothetical protein
MTASKTARLGLMNPVGSDAFVTADFAQAFGILDANPGILPVANQSSRPTSYTASQHGSLVYQTDLNILWSWYQPSSGVVGQWQRVGNIGYLNQFSNSGTVGTTTVNYSSGSSVITGTVTVPGGRPILVMLSWTRLDSTKGASVLSYWENNVKISDTEFYGWTGDSTSDTFWFYRNPAPNSSLSLSVKLTIAAKNGLGGTSTIGNSNLAIFEM